MVQLIMSVLHSIQASWCSAFLLPKQILKKIEATCRRFLWSRSDLSKNGAKVAWQDICSPKKGGGLRVNDVFVWNNACTMKHLWDLTRKKDSLWVKWYDTFILRGRNLWNCPCGSDSSWTWRKLMKLRQLAVGFIKYVVGNGSEIWL